ncbi:hypothetical protein [Paenibacillus sp. PCH8]|uniref:hypothetical protein n=1 Tax=Paenibacillus sp. PCH8 TaxID=2066524 RepID=UPI0015E45E0B|nr:hypothetical protein [Paenibacillus sp. PCH8]
MELSSELALALNQEGYETINDINDITIFLKKTCPKHLTLVSYEEDSLELLIDADNGRLVYENNYWRAEMSIVPGVLEQAVEEYEAAGGDGYNDPFETEDSSEATSDQDEEYHKESDPSIDYDPNEEDPEARWDKILRDRLKASERTE